MSTEQVTLLPAASEPTRPQRWLRALAPWLGPVSLTLCLFGFLGSLSFYAHFTRIQAYERAPQEQARIKDELAGLEKALREARGRTEAAAARALAAEQEAEKASERMRLRQRDLAELETAIAKRVAERNAILKELQTSQGLKENASEEIARLQATQQELSQRLEGAQRAIAAAEGKAMAVYQLEGRLDGLQQREREMRKLVATLEGERAQTSTALAEARGQVSQLSEERTKLMAEQSRLRGEVQAGRKLLDETQLAIGTAETKRRDAERIAAQAGGRIAELDRRGAQLQATVSSLEKRANSSLKELEERLKRLPAKLPAPLTTPRPPRKASSATVER